jgi:hypothetical protein
MQMSEATLATTIPALQAGAIVLARLDDDFPRLAIVTDLPDSETAQVIPASGPDEADDLRARTIARACLMAAPDELDTTQQHMARYLTLKLACHAQEYASRLRSDCIRLQEQADAADRKIASMRAYAISKCDDGTICQEGLNEFLAAHDLDLYEPRHTARVTIALDVEVDGADDFSEAASMIRDCIEATSSDDDQVRITWEYDTDITELHAVTRD